MSLEKTAKEAIDSLIRKSRVHLYKPMQIAEILYKHRIEGKLNLNNLEEYRSASKKWRDDVTNVLVGSASTSSSRFQDDVFSQTAISPIQDSRNDCPNLLLVFHTAMTTLKKILIFLIF
jgi:hypothetical protein